MDFPKINFPKMDFLKKLNLKNLNFIKLPSRSLLITAGVVLTLGAGTLLFLKYGGYEITKRFIQSKILARKQEAPTEKTPVVAKKKDPEETPKAAPPSTDRGELIKEALELSGVKKLTDQYPIQLKTQLLQRRADLEQRVLQRIEEMATSTFRADIFYKAVTENFHNKFDEKYMSDVLQFLRSPLSKKITDLEIKGSDPEAEREIQQFAAQLQSRPPAKERLRLIQRLDRASGATDVAVQTFLTVLREMTKGAYNALPPEERMKQGVLEDHLEPLLKDTKAQIEEPIRNNIRLSYLFMYRTLPDQELAKYIRFHETLHGRWFSRVTTEGLMTATAAASEKFGEEMMKLGKEAAQLVLGTKRQEEARYSAMGRRDPFNPRVLGPRAGQRGRDNLSPLERYDIGQLKLVGIIWDIREPRAMVEDTAGLGYIIKIGTPIGVNEGKVSAIKPTEVLVEEIFTDLYGTTKKREISIKFPPG